MKSWWGAFIGGLLLIGVGLAFREYGYEPFRVATPQMSPTYSPGDWIWIEKWPFRLPPSPRSELRRGDIVVVRVERGVSVGRVVGLEGDQISIRAGRLRINGKPAAVASSLSNSRDCATEATPDLAQQWEACFSRPFTETSEPTTVGPGEIYVLGDLRRQLFPFPTHGKFKASALVGRVVWSLLLSRSSQAPGTPRAIGSQGASRGNASVPEGTAAPAIRP